MPIDGEIHDRVPEKVEYSESVVERLSRKQDIERDEYLNDREYRATVEVTLALGRNLPILVRF